MILKTELDQVGSLMTTAGWALLIVGLLHIPVWMVFGGEWEGAISWRKPILFGISTGLTLLSLGWIADYLVSQNSRLRFVSRMIAFSLTFEVGLIVLQQWRGRASHFNRDTFFDGSVDAAMVVLICVAVVGIIYLGVQCLRGLNLEEDYRRAANAGMMFLLLSCGIGFLISGYGYSKTSLGESPETIGANGVARFPHGVAIHALQLFPFAVWLLRKTRADLTQRVRVIGNASWAMLFLFVFACYQTVNGYSRFEIATVTSAILLALSGGCFLLAMVKVDLPGFRGHSSQRSV